ncbi:uncharacterized protein LOC125861361 [Solanum stenotomum]|uniref:uncharacterized protein LOC125861361 n=1 Tax=Solanum stenotomum TaxID=172797 RepID=UPI0020D11BED|nr:uncharacterized protein LOC125861361 [Solanum stenotomum]
MAQEGFYKCGQVGHFMKECPKNWQGNGNQGNIAQSSSVAPPDRTASPPDRTASRGGFYKCGQVGHFMKECPKNWQGNGNQGNIAQSSSVAPPDRTASPPDRTASRGATSGTGGGANCIYAITSRQ